MCIRDSIKIVSVPVSIIFIVGGAIAIAFGGDVTVDAASRIDVYKRQRVVRPHRSVARHFCFWYFRD